MADQCRYLNREQEDTKLEQIIFFFLVIKIDKKTICHCLKKKNKTPWSRGLVQTALEDSITAFTLCKRNRVSIHTIIWICCWGKLGQRNIVTTATSTFSKISVFNVWSVHTIFENLRFQSVICPHYFRKATFSWRTSKEDRPNCKKPQIFQGALWTRPNTSRIRQCENCHL